MKISLSGKNVLITGASMGIGRGLSKCFAKDGAHLFLTDLPSQKEQLLRYASELESDHGIKTWTFTVDITDPKGPEALYHEATERTGGIDVLVNNAGICFYGKFDEMNIDRLDKMVLLNCLGYAKLMRLVIPSMIERDSGAILNVSSVAAFQPLPSLALYAATKAFTQSLTEGISGDLPFRSKVRVATLNPPFTRTALINDAGVPEDFIPFTISFKTVDEVVELGYKAFKNGRLFYVPGWQNKALHLGIMKFLPRRAVNLMGRLTMKRWSDYL
ncbi:MAG: SDR family NAD(P)-dependent oxidoreductase [Desulfomonilia bacterium]|jgi:short-subunit dehydrogenase